MERKYIEREPTKEEIKKFIHVIRDEKNIPLATFEPVKILEYRNYTIPIYMDEPGQQYFVIFEDDEWGNPMGDCDDFCDFLDSKLDSLVADRSINVLNKELSDLAYEILKLKLVRKTYMGDILYLKFKSIERDIHKWLKLASELLQVPIHVYKDLLELDPIVKEQIERLALREMYNDVVLIKDKGE